MAPVIADATTLTSLSPQRTLRADARRNRERILRIARNMVIQEGSDIGMDVIAKGVGVGVGTLYRHFPTKQALIAEILGTLLHERMEAFDQATEQPDPKAGLKFLIDRWAHISAEESGITTVIDEPNMKEACPEAQAALQLSAERFVAKMQRTGVICSSISVANFLALLCGMTRSVVTGAPAQLTAQVLYDGLRCQK